MYSTRPLLSVGRNITWLVRQIQAFQLVRESEGAFPLPFSGLGRMALRDYCKRCNVDLDSLLAHFPGDLAVDPDRSFRELADELETDPEGVIERLNERARSVTR